jgi:hypothetical protein
MKDPGIFREQPYLDRGPIRRFTVIVNMLNFVPNINHRSIFFPAAATMPITYSETEERVLKAIAYI